MADAIGIVHSLDRRLLPLLVTKSLLVSAVPYIAILLSAEIINRLGAGSGFTETLTYAAVSTAVIFLLTVLGDWLRKACDVRRNHCLRLYDFAKNKKTMEMDFAELESPALTNLRNRLHAEESMGFSFSLFLSFLDNTAEAILSAILSLALLIPAMATIIRNDNSKMPVVGITIFVVISTALSVIVSILRKHNDSKALARIKDPGYWPDEVMQRDVMASGGTFTYKEGKDIRIYGFQGMINRVLAKNMQFLLGCARDFATIPAFFNGAVGAVRGLIMGGSFMFVALFITGVSALPGTVILLASLLYRFTSGLALIVADITMLIPISESLNLYLQFTAVPDTMYKGSIPVEKRDDREYEIEFRDVSFKYPGSETFALRHLNLKLNVGKRLAVVGLNGSGKTTMIKLLCRLYDPTEGEILLNGINISKYDQAEYRTIFSVVFQDFKLFSFELGQVIAASATVDSGRAETCLRKAGLEERLGAMRDGIKTPLYKDYDDGLELSGGEAQKAAIARALYRNAPFIILDEPTAALDPVSEYEVYTKFNELIEDRTAIFISHRLSSCRFCDDIAVFHEGSLIQRGSHDALLSDETGKYHELWTAQAQYYIG